MRLYRTIMTIKRIEENYIFAISGQWDPNKEFSFNKSIVPDHIIGSLNTNDLLIADMNLEEDKKENLELFNFELPDPDLIKKIGI